MPLLHPKLVPNPTWRFRNSADLGSDYLNWDMTMVLILVLTS